MDRFCPWIARQSTTSDQFESTIPFLPTGKLIGHLSLQYPLAMVSRTYVCALYNPHYVVADEEQTVPSLYAKTVCERFAMLGLRGVSLLFGSGDQGVGDNDPVRMIFNFTSSLLVRSLIFDRIPKRLLVDLMMG